MTLNNRAATHRLIKARQGLLGGNDSGNSTPNTPGSLSNGGGNQQPGGGKTSPTDSSQPTPGKTKDGILSVTSAQAELLTFSPCLQMEIPMDHHLLLRRLPTHPVLPTLLPSLRQNPLTQKKPTNLLLHLLPTRHPPVTLRRRQPPARQQRRR